MHSLPPQEARRLLTYLLPNAPDLCLYESPPDLLGEHNPRAQCAVSPVRIVPLDAAMACLYALPCAGEPSTDDLVKYLGPPNLAGRTGFSIRCIYSLTDNDIPTAQRERADVMISLLNMRCAGL